MPLSEKDVLEQLRNHGVTTLEQLAEHVAKVSAAKATFLEARQLSEGEKAGQVDYTWTGVHYSLHHPE